MDYIQTNVFIEAIWLSASILPRGFMGTYMDFLYSSSSGVLEGPLAPKRHIARLAYGDILVQNIDK